MNKYHALWLHNYQIALNTSPWWSSEKKIYELAMHMTLQELDDRIGALEAIIYKKTDEET